MHSSTRATPSVKAITKGSAVPLIAPGAGRNQTVRDLLRAAVPCNRGVSGARHERTRDLPLSTSDAPLALISARVNAIHADPVVRAAPVKANWWNLLKRL